MTFSNPTIFNHVCYYTISSTSARVLHEPLGEAYYYGPERMSNRFTAENRPEEFKKFADLTSLKVREARQALARLSMLIPALRSHRNGITSQARTSTELAGRSSRMYAQACFAMLNQLIVIPRWLNTSSLLSTKRLLLLLCPIKRKMATPRSFLRANYLAQMYTMHS